MDLELEFDTNASQSGFRLQYMELLNWGTFHEKIWRIVPDGNNSLLTGAVGSGKSTVVDALTSLIVPNYKIQFNKAAGAEKQERNLLSYIKGYYKHEKDELTLKEKAISLRYNGETDRTFSVILANFHNRGYESNVTLAQVFWIKDNKPQKLLIISRLPLSIKEHLTDMSDIAELKRRLKNMPHVELFEDNFTQYSQQFRRYFGMTSDKAIDLFNQTVSMKSVSSLTSFVREQMLEKTDVKQQIEDLRKRFSDLSKAHEAVVRLRQQKELLDPLYGFAKQQADIKNRIEEVNAILKALPVYFATKKLALLEVEIQVCLIKINQLDNQLNDIKKDLDIRRQAEMQIRRDIDSNGGKRLEELERQIAEKEKIKTDKRERHNRYAELATICNIPIAGTDKTFYSNLQKAGVLIASVEGETEVLNTSQVDKKVELRELEDIITNEEKELQSLLSRKTQIPDEMLNIRQQIIEDLDISEEEMPFVGEILKVREENKEWEGAIERLLHGFGLSMIVSEVNYKQVSQYVNARKLETKSGGNVKGRGQRLEYYKVPAELKYKINIDNHPDSVLNKVQIKPESQFDEWLEAELQKRFSIRCVSMEEFQRQRDVLTIEGHLKTGETRHVKDDRRALWDRKSFILGWTNTDKIKAIQESLQVHHRNKQQLDTQLAQIKKVLLNNRTLLSKLAQLILITNWSEINWQDEAREIERLKQEQLDLQRSNDILNTLKIRLNAVLEEIRLTDLLRTEKDQEKGKINFNVESYKELNVHCLTIIEESGEDIKLFFSNISALVTHELTLKNMDGISGRIERSFTDRDGEKDNLQRLLRGAESKITKQMQAYKDRFPSEAIELSTEVDDLPEYLKKVEGIVKQDLPRHERRFKEMLNESTINDISAFDNKLDIHKKGIEAKIEKINEHLEEIEYNTGTCIRIETDKSPDVEIKTFREDIKACYANLLGTQDAYTEERFDQVKKLLDRFNGQSNLEIEWTNKVTDVRNWFLFNASERFLEDGSPKEFYSGSGGKSGGQKEKLAYTILASAVAYQFGLSYGESKSKSFRFVVIDEAFGKGDDDSTRFGLGLFKKLNLQLLIVTPLQKIHIIENHVSAVHYVSNSDGRFSEIQNLTVEEYKVEKLKNELAQYQ